MLKTLRIRIVLILTLLIISVMLVVGTFFLNSISNFYHDDFKKQMTTVLQKEEFTQDIRNTAASENEVKEIYEKLRAYSGPLGIDSYRNFYVLDGKTGGFLIGSSDETQEKLERTPNLASALTGNVGDKVQKTSNYLDYAVSITTKDGNGYVVYVKDSKEELQEMIWMLFAIIIQALFVGLMIAVGMSFFLAKAITNPVESLTKSAKQVAAGDFSHRLPVVSKDEIGVLTKTFNQMAVVLKNTMEEIEEEKNKLATIFLFLTDGVIAFTKYGTLIHMNNAAKDMLLVEEEENFTFGNLFSDYYINVDFNEILNLEKNENLTQEMEVNGRVLRMCFARFDADLGKGEEGIFGGGIITVLQDITEQRRFEESRKEFVANVSHELRTPLTSVKSYTETVLENPDLPPEMTQKFLKVVLYETDRMTRLVKDLLVLSRLDSKKMDWVFADFNMEQLLQNIYDSTLMDAKNHDHTLTLDVDHGLMGICGDKDRIEQVVINIVSNAIKYTPDGGTVGIVASNQENGIAIKVTDNGLGIPKEDVPRLFDRFYRVDKARSREKGGTGLGLAIAKEIIFAHQGTIEVQSEVEKGTAITIYLPMHHGVQVERMHTHKEETPLIES